MSVWTNGLMVELVGEWIMDGLVSINIYRSANA